jgi:hypothetical protein
MRDEKHDLMAVKRLIQSTRDFQIMGQKNGLNKQNALVGSRLGHVES